MKLFVKSAYSHESVSTILNPFVKLLEPITNFIFGYSLLKGIESESVSYVKAAQKVKIWGRKAFSPDSMIESPRNYLYSHIQYCHPEIVLQTDKVTLQVYATVCKNKKFTFT